MSHSPNTYAGRFFRGHDANFQVVVLALLDAHRDRPSRNPKFDEMLRDWLEQRHWAIGAGCFDLHLDQWLCDDQATERYLISLLNQVRENLARSGSEISEHEMNDFMDRHGWPSHWNLNDRYVAPQPVKPILKLIDDWMGVITGEQDRP